MEEVGGEGGKEAKEEDGTRAGGKVVGSFSTRLGPEAGRMLKNPPSIFVA